MRNYLITEYCWISTYLSPPYLLPNTNARQDTSIQRLWLLGARQIVFCKRQRLHANRKTDIELVEQTTPRASSNHDRWAVVSRCLLAFSDRPGRYVLIR